MALPVWKQDLQEQKNTQRTSSIQHRNNYNL
jgi:hypothetical protein